ncbi:c-type cytochrome (plasmid) [Agrobacterium radiobacter]|uniref:Cytochrome c n=1 Tax=Agrobacterium tumefaciens str. B6 TaxID=1183423 RepID=A0A822VD20_AGRTU|nr:cytochrome c [Agrobacterium tumefaciens]MQB27886.1 cytochrome c [Agrobacterium tumefaciens]NTA08339.1 c-type cytochrome [Agrobacterium tumefaciens]NTB16161.1 c-type cytochrome [Agrobacterium tumefaciens]CVI25389.1 Cytochrome c [Agrobacterium tumefaciens str. B6]SPZ33099.1 cytochrome-c oxidase [Agrobacterium tumefaciens]
MSLLPRNKLKLGAAAVGLVIVAGCVALGGVYGFTELQYKYLTRGDDTAQIAPTPERIARGEYLARMGDCVACHTAPGGKPFAGGLPLDTGFGVVLSSNITPDKGTGIGGWSLRQFDLAMRHGIGDDGKRLYPAMPYNTYAKISDDDLIDIKFYIDTLSPVANAVDSNQMSFPFNIRPMMMGWNLLFLDSGPLENDQSKSAEWNRGRYIVDSLGHCTTCHSPKNLLGGDTSAYLGGAVLQDWFAPRIGGDAWPAVADWTNEDIATYLKTGANQHAIAAGPMAEAIQNSTQYLAMEDLRAVATYLKEVEGSEAPKVQTVSADSALPYPEGGRIYDHLCSTCHNRDGSGVPQMGPALRANTAIKGENGKFTTLRMILAGGYSAETQTYPTGFAMPGFDWKLSDQEAANVANYVRNAWGNSSPEVSQSKVREIRIRLKSPTAAD